ncbi:MAG: 2-deoxy-D-gluconate 3-dehydrogenase [Phycisphaerae bacterium]
MILEGKSCIVTGAGRGIGQAIARRLCLGGADVLAAARTARELEETVAICASAPGRCTAAVTNMTRAEDVQAMVQTCLDTYGQVDVLVNNAGVAPLTPFDEMTDTIFTDLLAVNVHSVFLACKAIWPTMKTSGGTIVNISSMAAMDPFLGFAAYGATKAWVNTFTKAIAEEGRPFGIRAFALGPGAVETQLLRTAMVDFPAEQALSPDHVAEAVEWLLDDRCRHASGQTIYVRK